MNVESGLVDEITQKLSTVLSPYFDYVKAAYVHRRPHIFSENNRKSILIDIVFQVQKYGQTAIVEFPVRVSDWEITYCVTGKCVNTGAKFNLTTSDVDHALFKRGLKQ